MSAATGIQSGFIGTLGRRRMRVKRLFLYRFHMASRPGRKAVPQ
jgi:hypothetical protein